MVVNLGKKPGAGKKRSGKAENKEESSKETKATKKQRKPAKRSSATGTAARASSARKKVASRDAGETKQSAGKRPGKSKIASAASAKSRKIGAGQRATKKKTAAGSGVRNSAEAHGGIRSEEPLCEAFVENDSQQLRLELAKKKVKGSVPDIVEAMVKKAKQGSYSHAKTLLEMTGARQMFDEDTRMDGEGESWAKRVLERMQEAEQTESQEKPPDAAERRQQS